MSKKNILDNVIINKTSTDQTRNALANIRESKQKQIRESIILPSTIHLKNDIDKLLRRRTTELLVKNVEKLSKFQVILKTGDGVTEDKEQHETDFTNLLEKPETDHVFEISKSTENIRLTKHSKSFEKISHQERVVNLMRARRSSSKTTTIPSENIAVRSLLFEKLPRTRPLPTLEATALAIVLQETLDFLELLQYSIKKEDIYHNNYQTRKEKNVISSIVGKLQTDWNYLFDVLENTMTEIKCHGKYERLEREVNKIAKRQEEENLLETNRQIWIEMLKQLKELIKINQFENTKLTNTSETMNIGNIEVDNLTFLNGAKLGYIKKWEDNRLEQEKLKATQKESELIFKITEYIKLEKAEHAVSGEIRAYLKGKMKDMESEIEAWKSHYSDELERREQEFEDLQEQIKDQEEELNKLSAQLTERQTFIDECFVEKERIQKEEVYWQAVNKAATIIQSLWRGHMVRNRLGKYKELWEIVKRRKKKTTKRRKKDKKKVK